MVHEMGSFTITLDSERCIGCWECYYLCPNENFIKQENRKVAFLQEYNCLGCLSCLYACPQQCINISQIYDYNNNKPGVTSE